MEARLNADSQSPDAPCTPRSAVTSPVPEPYAGDAALRRLYETNASVLLSYILRLTRGDWQRAEDIVQETLMRAWRHPEAQLPDGQWSRPWLFTVARRIAIDHLRATLIRPVEYGDPRLDERPATEDRIERLLNAQEVRAALAALPQRLRDVLIEVYFRERSVAEAAQTLGIPPGTVKSRTFYALRALRGVLDQRGFRRADR
jgi:RNA polymerase sigma-70 factor, ECF subfamily